MKTTETTKMKVAFVTSYGKPEVLKIQMISKPAPKNDEVLVKIKASSASMADSMMLTGKPYIGRLFIGLKQPKHPVPGTGFSGVVECIGNKVLDFKPGDRVFGETTVGFSTNADYLIIKESNVILHLPECIDFAEAATFCDGHLTSFNFLRKVANVKSGQNVLINGASGSLGTAAVQIAKLSGAHVTGVCSSRNIELVKSLGADEVIDYTKNDFSKSIKKYNLIFDAVGKSSYSKCKKILKPQGLYLSPVLNFNILIHSLSTSFSRNKKARFEATGMLKAVELKGMLDKLLVMRLNGEIQTVIDKKFPLDEIRFAHEYISIGHKKGNVVIDHSL